MLIRLAFWKVVFSWGEGGNLTPHPFIFQKELIQYQNNFMQLLKNLFKVSWKWKSFYIICCKLTSLVSLLLENVKTSKKLIKIDENS